MINRFGRPAYELVFEPLAAKVWGDPSSLHANMAKTRVPSSGGLDVILKLLGIKKETMDTNAELFYYPTNGFLDFPETFRQEIEALGGQVITGVEVQEIIRKGNRITAVRASVNDQRLEFPADLLISSVPLLTLGRLIYPTQPDGVLDAIEDLQFRHLILIYIFVNRPLVLEDQWIFFPERDFIFSRIFEQKQMNPDLGPDGETAICCDFTCAEGSWEWGAGDDVLVEKAVDGLVTAGFIGREEVIDSLVKRVGNFYPRYDLGYVEKIKKMNSHLQQVENLLLTGRIGMYNYNNSDHCVDMGRFISENLVRNKAPNEIWNELEKRVAAYRIVD
jgi:protoporphyrinogen oxidase